jgi:hypothetical protein
MSGATETRRRQVRGRVVKEHRGLLWRWGGECAKFVWGTANGLPRTDWLRAVVGADRLPVAKVEVSVGGDGGESGCRAERGRDERRFGECR